MALDWGLGVQRVSVLFAIAVMAISAAFGVGYGVLTALCSVVAFDFFIETPRLTPTLGSRQDAANLVVFLLTAWLAGAYTETVRRRRAGVRALYASAGALTQFGPGASESLARTVAEIAPFSPLGWLRRELASISIVVVAVAVATGVAVVAQETFHIERVSLIFLAAVVVTAILLGARFALVAAVLAVISFNYFLLAPQFVLDLGAPQDLLNLGVFTCIGWWAGGYADRVREEREAIRLLLIAGEQLVGLTDEAALRDLICKTVSRAVRSPAAIVDETGVHPSGRRGPDIPPAVLEAAASAGGQTIRCGAWRVRRLHGAGQDLGAVVWTSPNKRAAVLSGLDETIGAFIDRGGGAIALVRMLAQRSEAEVAARTERVRNALLASVSHDFRTPLAGILGAATSLLEFPTEHDRAVSRDLLLNIEQQARRLNRYMENLLSASQLDGQALTIRARPTPLQPLVASVWDELSQATGGVRALALQGLADAIVCVDPALLRQILANPFDNAGKFSPPGSTVTVRMEEADGYVKVDIEDEGPGVPSEERGLIFGRFYQSPNSRAGGVGLGLYIAHTLVGALGGRIAAGRRRDGRSGLAISLHLPSAKGIVA